MEKIIVVWSNSVADVKVYRAVHIYIAGIANMVIVG